MNTDRDVRDLLERMAREPVIGPVDPEPIMRRAHRRLARTVVLGFACVALLAGVAIGGVNLVLSSPTVPATPNPTDGDLPPILRDGEVLIQNFHGGQLEAVDPSTGDRRTILDCEAVSIPAEDSCGRIGDPAISADGRWLAYNIVCGGYCAPGTGIWVTNARGDKHQLAEGGQEGQQWAWSPQGSTLATYVDGEASGLVTIDPQTGDRTTVASPSGGVWALAWSPDGTEIVYARPGLVESVDLESGEITELADVGGGAIAWSPDGSRIAFDDHGGGRNRIIVMNRDGSDQHVLVEAASLQRSPFWSPDGTEIAYTMMRRDPVGDQFGHYSLEVWVIGVDGSNDTRLYHSQCCAGGGEYPVWSPDGGRIAFSPQIDGQSSRWIVVNADGTGSPEPIDQTEVVSW
jgi:Tol biopolymer transport system component